MKATSLILVVLLAALVGQAQPAPTFQQRQELAQPPSAYQQRLQRLSPAPAPDIAAAKAAANYIIRVEWTQAKGDPQSLEVLTTEGHFDLSTVQKSSVKINGSEIPTTLKFEGTLTALDEEKGRLQLFLGRTIPYVTGSYGSGPSASSSYSQMSVGLDSTFLIKFGKPDIIQDDESGQISVLVKRVKI
ncbi:MAG TPA: hypothetical protein VNV43_04150 [Candidatus Acidoferrales bacterium]|jgi:hypothetical protein|nr:hypothetical protein [Candidatus Acidoferrales bacterium]